ncbi:MAG: lysoplasmalogenase [Muribaculaceae bacterium]|nr:lysoplasmalogenase [Muribaculaceae bacterium]
MMKASIILVYILLSLVYFCPIDIPYKTALPAFALVLWGISRVPLKIVLAMFFSVIGDAMGEQGLLILQIVAFAIAHVFLILQFMAMRHRPIIPLNKKDNLLLILLCAIVSFVIYSIALNVGDLVIQSGIIIYAVVIGLMVFMALTQSVMMVKIGAVLFMASDIILAWTIFKEPMPYASYFIMIPYYLAQLSIFVGTMRKNNRLK